MSEKIQPALVADEWEKILAGKTIRREWNGLPLWYSGSVVGEGSEYAHAAAAVSLYGQPFGFSWGDVDLLRRFCAREVFQPEHPATAEDNARVVGDLADRIAALLPPQPLDSLR